MVKKRIINNINDHIDSYGFNTYNKIKAKLHIDNFEFASTTKESSKKTLRIVIPITAVFFSGVACLLTLLLPFSLKQDNARLAEFNDRKAIAVLASNQSALAASVPSLGLDKVYEDYSSFKENNQNNKGMNYLYETKLSSESVYKCFYLPESTIAKIDTAISEKTIPEYLYDNIELSKYSNPYRSYLRIYWYLCDQNKLSSDDAIYVDLVGIENKTIDTCIENCLLVKAIRTINIQNANFGKCFFENIEYQYNEQMVSIMERKTISETYHNKKIVFFNTPYLKSIFSDDIYEASFLDYFSYLIDEKNNTFETFIDYDQYLLQKDEHYYDIVNDIILKKDYITTTSYYDSSNVLHTLDQYTITCDYSKAKSLFAF